ncbi:hypothetical protein M2146_001110 [Lachnospiraceae bacterium PF1-22]
MNTKTTTVKDFLNDIERSTVSRLIWQDEYESTLDEGWFTLPGRQREMEKYIALGKKEKKKYAEEWADKCIEQNMQMSVESFLDLWGDRYPIVSSKVEVENLSEEALKLAYEKQKFFYAVSAAESNFTNYCKKNDLSVNATFENFIDFAETFLQCHDKDTSENDMWKAIFTDFLS